MMIPPKSILLVEDERDLSRLVRYNLEREGHACRCVFDGASALAEVRHRPPDLIILDRMLPGVSGDDVARALRRESATAAIPIIMLTAKAEEADELTGFALGADDYVTKPFSIKALLARVAALLRRSRASQQPAEMLRVGPFVLDRGRHEVTVDGAPVSLTTTEFRLLAALMAAGGRVLSRSQLIDETMGADVVVTDRTIDVHITTLRKKIVAACTDPGVRRWIRTVRGVGYSVRKPD